MGSINECLEQEDCFACFHKLLWSYKNKIDRAKALNSLSAQPKVKFDSDAPDKVSTVLKGVFKIFEMDNAVTMLTRLSNPDHNSIIGEGLESSKAILEAILYGCTSAAHQVLGEPVDFVVTARALLAMLKGFAMGNIADDLLKEFTTK